MLKTNRDIVLNEVYQADGGLEELKKLATSPKHFEEMKTTLYELYLIYHNIYPGMNVSAAASFLLFGSSIQAQLNKKRVGEDHEDINEEEDVNNAMTLHKKKELYRYFPNGEKEQIKNGSYNNVFSGEKIPTCADDPKSREPSLLNIHLSKHKNNRPTKSILHISSFHQSPTTSSTDRNSTSAPRVSNLLFEATGVKMHSAAKKPMNFENDNIGQLLMNQTVPTGTNTPDCIIEISGKLLELLSE